MPGASCTRSLVCEDKKHTSKVTTGSARSARHSPRNGFNGFLRALPGVHDVSVTVIGTMQSIVANLTPAKGRAYCPLSEVRAPSWSPLRELRKAKGTSKSMIAVPLSI
jgi:hypothetical protein